PSAEEQAAFAQMGTVSAGTRMQAMASADGVAVPVELKAVDDKWPMIGRFTLKDGREARAPPPGSAWIAEGAAERLAVKAGDRFSLGGRELTVGGIIAGEPDRLSEGFALGPVVIVDARLPQQAGLLTPGAMFRAKTRIVLPPGASPDAVIDSFKARFPDASYSWRTRDRAAPGAERFVARMGEFLVLVGLAALVIAGIGIGGG
ncbi:MAG TPA: ABC transporter permease, partial [Novosphingobium sp.]|nr:ABC transporter permease [Novosphingobium sp.]